MDAADRRRRPSLRIPADLAGLLIAVAATVLAVAVPGVRETWIRLLVGVPFLLFGPGYAVVAALFPGTGVPADSSERPATGVDEGESRPGQWVRSGIDAFERVALSFGTSVVLVAAVASLLTLTPWGLEEWTLVTAVSLVTVAGVAVATYRRRRLPESSRVTVSYRRWLGRRLEAQSEAQGESLLTVVLVVSLLLAAGSVGYVVAAPAQPEPYTELSLLTEDDDGELVASGYPTNLTTGENASVTLVVENQEGESLTYSVVVLLQEVRGQNGSLTVQEQDRLDEFSVTVPHNRSRQIEATVSPARSGSELRLVFLLYKTAPPPDPTVDDAYRTVHLSVDVGAPTNASELQAFDSDLTGPAVTERLGPR